ncbi:MAG TPA: tetratricopeptide repeat protein [Candidatus Binatia bacterium]|nr:tetratricopeptide repeat protein [Candidatus Binatia bacterium]
MAFDRAKALANAEKSVKAGKIPEAIAEYKKLAEDNSRDMGVINKLGDLCVRAGKNQDAIRYFLRIAEYYAGDGFFLKAIAMYKKISKLDPANVDCLQKLAGLYQQQGLTIEAKAQYLSVADRHVKSGQVKKALEVFPRILEIEPDNIKIRMTYADMLVRSGSVPEAGREYRQVAQELAKKGMLDEAIKIAQKGSKLVPGDADMMSLVLTLTKEAEKSPGELLATVVQVARANGDNPRSLALLGEAYLAAGKTADAEKVFQKLRGMQDAPPEVAAAVARFYISKDDADSALDWVSRAADGYLAASKPTDGTGLLDEYLRAFPNHPGGLERKASVAEAAGDKAARFEALFGLAEVRLHAGDADGAAGFVAQMQGVDPQNPKCAEMLERVAQRRGGGAKAAPGRSPAAARPAEAAVPDIQEGALVLDETPSIDAEVEVEEEVSGSDALGDVDDEVGPNSRIQDMGEEPDEDGIETEDEEFISEHFTEAEVFVKYGLLEKAKEQLLKILEKYAKHLPSHTKLKEIYYEEGDKEKAVSECLVLAELLKAKNRPEEAQDQLNEAIRIDPNNPRLRDLTAAAPAAPAKAPAAKPPVAKAAPDKPAPAAAARPARPEPPPAKPIRTAAAPAPELEIEELETDGSLDIEPTAHAAAPETVVDEESGDSGLELEIEMEDEPAPAKPVPAPPASRPAPASRAAAPKAQPEKIEEETPDDLPGEMSLGDLGGDLSLEVEEEDAPRPVPAGADEAETVTAVAGRDPDPEKLGEVDFYIDQGLLEEARAVLFQLQKQHPGSGEVAQRFERANRPPTETPKAPASRAPEPGMLDLDVERAFGAQTMVIQAPRAVAPMDAPRASKAKPVFRVEKQQEAAEGDFFDLAGELDRSLAEAQVAVDTQEAESVEGPGHSIDEIFRAFKKGVEQQVDSQDYETHYNLGIAYKEMGLVDEAIGEFQYAARDPGKVVECCGILGLCFREKGMPQLALKWYQKGLDTPSLGEHEAMGLRYDMAEVHREQGEYKKAMQTFSEVYGMDSTYRDVAAKIKEMKKLLG